MKNKTTENYNFSDIGKIDLKEAEAVANENILLITEEDLIDEIGGFDFLKSYPGASSPRNEAVVKEPPAAKQETKPESEIIEPETDFEISDMVNRFVNREDSVSETGKPQAVSDDSLLINQDVQSADFLESEPEIIPVQENQVISDEQIQTASEVKESIEPLPDENHKINPELESGMKKVSDSIFEDSDDIFYSPDTDTFIAVSEIKEMGLHEISGQLVQEPSPYSSLDKNPLSDQFLSMQSFQDEYDDIVYNPEKDIFLISAEDTETTISSGNKYHDELKITNEENTDSDIKVSSKPLIHERPKRKYDDSVGMEILPDMIRLIEIHSQNTFFIDDDLVDITSRPKKDSVQLVDERLSDIQIEMPLQKSILLYEDDPRVDREKFSHISEMDISYNDISYETDELEFKYVDDELDFVHSSIIGEDYSRYIMEIDEYHDIKTGHKVTRAIELMGLTVSDIELIEDRIFDEDFKNADLDTVSDFYADNERKKAGAGHKIIKYLTVKEDSLSELEKASIEEDISSGNALIFEEDVNLIIKNLRELIGEVKNESVEVVDAVYDITDKVVILDDEEDVNRFMMDDIPHDKHDDVRKLLTYLDGLFEKLPERAIKNFADSEYFNLYKKVLDDMGA